MSEQTRQGLRPLHEKPSTCDWHNTVGATTCLENAFIVGGFCMVKELRGSDWLRFELLHMHQRAGWPVGVVTSAGAAFGVKYSRGARISQLLQDWCSDQTRFCAPRHLLLSSPCLAIQEGRGLSLDC
jgi:hypothetical protein